MAQKQKHKYQFLWKKITKEKRKMHENHQIIINQSLKSSSFNKKQQSVNILAFKLTFLVLELKRVRISKDHLKFKVKESSCWQMALYHKQLHKVRDQQIYVHLCFKYQFTFFKCDDWWLKMVYLYFYNNSVIAGHVCCCSTSKSPNCRSSSCKDWCSDRVCAGNKKIERNCLI